MATHIDWLQEQAEEFFKVRLTSNVEDSEDTYLLQVFFPQDFDLQEIVRFGAIHKLPLGMVYMEDNTLVVEFIYTVS